MHRRQALVAGARVFRSAVNNAHDGRVDRIAIGNRQQCENSRVFAFQRPVAQALGEHGLRAQHNALAFKAHPGTQAAKARLVLPAFLKVCDFLLHARIP
ncbi:MAG: hypothetical protein ABSC92_15025 [Rhizomicrobium sp.]